jgi:hypothetical protein
MARRTDVRILQDFLKAQPNQRLSRAKLSDGLLESNGWGKVKVDRVIERAFADPESCIFSGPGGVVEYTGTESVKNPLLYTIVGRVLAKSWAPKHSLKDATSHVTAHSGRKGALDWMHPDVVIIGRPRRSSGPKHEMRCHSFEVEKQGGFRLESIFQAFVQGKGSHFSWVVFSEAEIKSDQYMERILWAARQVGVGLITYAKPNAYSTWDFPLAAKPRNPTKQESYDFQDHALGDILRPW